MKVSARFYYENSSENFDHSEHLYRLRRVSAARRNNGCFATGDSLPVRRLIKVFSSQMPRGHSCMHMGQKVQSSVY